MSQNAADTAGPKTPTPWYEALERIDRRIVYLFVVLSLSVPIVMNVRLRPAPMATANAFYHAVDTLEIEPGQIVLVALDWGPGTMAENRAQSAVAIEHLLRRRIPFALISIYTQAVPFLEEVPRSVVQRLEAENPGQRWTYGVDWVNFGFRPGGLLMIQNLAKSKNLVEELRKDANQIPLGELPALARVRTIADIPVLMEFTGLVGAFNTWLQYFPVKVLLHGCTSITIPDAFIYYSSGQIVGFFEGVAGAAWYEQLLNDKYPNRDSSIAIRINTGLSFAQLIVLGFIALGNAGLIFKRFHADAR